MVSHAFLHLTRIMSPLGAWFVCKAYIYGGGLMLNSDRIAVNTHRIHHPCRRMHQPYQTGDAIQQRAVAVEHENDDGAIDRSATVVPHLLPKSDGIFVEEKR